MKQLFLAVALCLFAPLGLLAQGKINGYILTNSKDTIKGSVHMGTPAQRTIRIGFTDAKTGEFSKFEPLQIIGFGIYSTGQFFESKTWQPSAAAEFSYAVFMERKNLGFVREYEYWNTEGDRGYIMTFLQRGEENLKEVDFLNFKRQLAIYFEDFPQLSDKIERGAFKKKDLSKMVEEYNIWRKRGW